MQVLYFIQYLLLGSAYWVSSLFLKCSNNTESSWVVGVDEVALCLYRYGRVLDATTVCLSFNTGIDKKYDYTLSIKNRFLRHAIRFFYGPVLLGYLATKHNYFFYTWHSGFLRDRAWEFKFLKQKQKKIVLFFAGSDIRSPKLVKQWCDERELDTFVDYARYQVSYAYYWAAGYESKKRRVAEVAQEYGDLIFSYPNDQRSYLPDELQIAIPYALDDEVFHGDMEKFDSYDVVKVIHAPSHPFNKGTPLVRAAIKKAKIKGYNIDYVEITGMPHAHVLMHLRSAHIVMNQFYGFLPGTFGVEGMANCCCVMQSADGKYDNGWFEGDAHKLWTPTGYWEVYDQLEYLLDNPEHVRETAIRGYEYACSHFKVEAVKARLDGIFREHGIYK